MVGRCLLELLDITEDAHKETNRKLAMANQGFRLVCPCDTYSASVDQYTTSNTCPPLSYGIGSDYEKRASMKVLRTTPNDPSPGVTGNDKLRKTPLFAIFLFH
jgi:hypothetical protein